uniref:gamma-hordein-1-like n=1 Tax=Scatophagus argus TaxID=75038 RepID=UPI001ED826D1|nr:gamma-hordein-1-like [Scatophagus argus]
MILIILLSCFAIVVSAIPTHPDVLPSQGGATQATNQKSDAQTPAPLSPKEEQPQPGESQQPCPQARSQFLPPTQHYSWPPVGGSPMIIPLPRSVDGSQPVNLPTVPQQPLIFPPYGYLPFFSPPYGNQLFPPYGFPMILASSPSQTPANQNPSGPVLPAETPFGAAPSQNAPQPTQQQQNPQIVYMFQQPMNPALGSLSSEELTMAAKMGQLGVYLPSVISNPSAGSVQSVNQAAGHSVAPTVGTSSQPIVNRMPVGLEGPTSETATVRTPVEPKQRNRQQKQLRTY